MRALPSNLACTHRGGGDGRDVVVRQFDTSCARMMQALERRRPNLAACRLASLRAPSVRLIDHGHPVETVTSPATRPTAMRMTAEQFLEYPLPDAKGELVRGDTPARIEASTVERRAVTEPA